MEKTHQGNRLSLASLLPMGFQNVTLFIIIKRCEHDAALRARIHLVYLVAEVTEGTDR